MAKAIVVLDIAALERSRISRGLFKAEVAQAAGISLSSAYRAFRDGACGIRVARKLAQALDLDLSELWLDGGPARQGTGGKGR